jgi:Phage baseplate assembly protein W
MWKGISYPVRAGEYGLVEVGTDEELIQGNIVQILGTRKGERVMLPLFGSRVMDFIHEPIDDITLQLLRVELVDAIKMWEPRVRLEEALLVGVPQEFRVLAHLRYLMKGGDGQERSFTVNISRTGGVSQWLD